MVFPSLTQVLLSFFLRCLGRSELPEGLKALFRPMTVMKPDLVLICENMLMAQGFVTAKVLASKVRGKA